MECGKLGLSSAIEVIVVSHVPTKGVNAYQMSKDGRSKTYGFLSKNPRDVLTWEFEKDFPVIGLYGYQKKNKQTREIRINQLGFYILDSVCAANKPEEENDGSEFTIEQPDFTD